jgi:hypothetical protein
VSDPSGHPPRPLAVLGAQIAQGDLDVPASIDEAMAGVTRDAMIGAGIPAPIAEMNAQAFSLNADGDAEWITDDVPSILGRPARSFEQFSADHAAAFA